MKAQWKRSEKKNSIINERCRGGGLSNGPSGVCCTAKGARMQPGRSGSRICGGLSHAQKGFRVPSPHEGAIRQMRTTCRPCGLSTSQKQPKAVKHRRWRVVPMRSEFNLVRSVTLKPVGAGSMSSAPWGNHWAVCSPTLRPFLGIGRLFI